MDNAIGNAGIAWGNTNYFDQYGAYTPWMSASDYQNYFNNRPSGTYPSRVEGRNEMGTPMFRAVFAPFHGTAWQSAHDMDCNTGSSTATNLALQGYQLVSMNSFVGADGLRKYQGTWAK